MKTYFKIISLASLCLTALSIKAASPTEETEPVRLPVYVIEAPRLTPAEKEIQQSLNALRAVTAKAMLVKFPRPLPEAKSTATKPEPKSSTAAVVVAGL